MINLRYLIFFLILKLFFLTSCSFDKKTGIWTGDEKELKRIEELEKASKGNKFKIFSGLEDSIKEVSATKSISLGPPQKNSSWIMSGLNIQNSSGNLYLEGIKNKFLKKRIGKNKFDVFQKMHSPLFFENNIILSDDKGTIYRINKRGKVYWKNNIYKKIYKKLYKNLAFTLHNNYIYIVDNIGFLYVLDLNNGAVIWKKNIEIPIKSNIKVFNNKIYIINQDNTILCLSIEDGSKIWEVRTVKTFIKSQNLLGLSVSEKGNLIIINSAGNVLKINSNNGRVLWTMNSLISLSAFESDFFKSSDIVINNNDVIFSNILSTFSINLDDGHLNWINKIKSSTTPIVDKENIFLVTDNGFFVNLDKKTGKIIWANNILKSLKKRKQQTGISGFVMGSGKIYITTLNGYLIICSATNGIVEYNKKIAKSINTAPIISNGELYILTSSSKILGFK